LDTRNLGKSNLRISKVGVGTAPIGSTPEWKIYWGPQDEKEAIRTIQTAIDLGVNWIDTAPFYGWGKAEQIVGKAIKGRRDQVHIFTKCGTLPDGKGGWTDSLKPESIRSELEESLQRLQTDYVDLYQFHDPDPQTPIEESWTEMQRLIEEGKVRYGGLSNHPTSLIERSLKVGPVASSQSQYNPLQRRTEREIFPFCLEHEIGVIGWGSLSEGVLADNFDIDKLDSKDFRRRQVYSRKENQSKIEMIRQAFRQVADAHGGTMVNAVIAWELMHPALTGAIIGVRSEDEAREMIGGTDWKLAPDEMSAIEDALAAWEGSKISAS
jgi:aryl-alcohol dehydrogenase-like predicted oxidoreductase